MIKSLHHRFLFTTLIAFSIGLNSCTRNENARSAIVNAVLKDTSDFYFINFKKFPSKRQTLPIGIFDSGTGGLAVMETLVGYDGLNNQSLEAGRDSLPDFINEDFVFLADQANMPYGNYFTENKTELLIEHIIKDAQFLLSNKYYSDVSATTPQKEKQPVKVIVVACNTATVYGKRSIEDLIRESGTEVKVIGVIDAGARGALSAIEKNDDATIGILATVGTIASKGYPTALTAFKKQLGYTGDIEIVGQGGLGIAESIDGEPNFVNVNARSISSDYKGPSFKHAEFPIDPSLLSAYQFDTTSNALLCGGDTSGECSSMQLNSPVNYVRYHIVSMLEQIKRKSTAPKLKAIILGCTHYPYLKKEIGLILTELFNVRRQGEYLYRDVMVENIKLIDPAENVAEELAMHMKEQKLFDLREGGSSQFFISVPNLSNPNIELAGSTHFTYAYKYGRNAGSTEQYVKMVPFNKENVSAEVLHRLSIAVPTVFNKIQLYMATDTLNIQESSSVSLR